MSDLDVTLFTGLAAASRRAERAAQTIADAGTTPAGPDAAATAPAVNPPRTVPAVDGGIGDGLVGAAVDLLQASIAYKANAAVIKADADLQRQLLRDFKV